MSLHYSKFNLNVDAGTPYFQANLPADYPLSLVIMASRAFRRLPPNLRKLAEASRAWRQAQSGYTGPGDITEWYDDQGNELDPETGKKLTDAEIDAEWDSLNLTLPKIKVRDLPTGDFPDPKTWEPPPIEAEPDEDGVSEEHLLSVIASHGRKRVSRDYGIPIEKLPGYSPDTVEEREGEDWDTATKRFKRRAARVLGSRWMRDHPEDRKVVVEALKFADMKWDLAGPADAAFDVAEDHT